MNLYKLLLPTFLTVYTLTGCIEEDFDENPVVVTEQIILTGGESVIISGRILSAKNIKVVDHGFEISTSGNFESIILISLGVKDVPGQFIGISNDLIIETNYFIRSFILLESGKKIEGNHLEFSTLTPAINSFTPLIAEAGQFMTVYGKNFTSKTEIYFGNVSAEILEITAASVLKLKIPIPSDGQYITKLSVVENNKKWEFDQNFEYIIGKWEVVSNFPFPLQLNSNVYTKQDDSFYFGQGKNGATNYNEMWKFDPSNFSFTEVDYPGNHILFGRFTFSGGFASGIASNNNSYDNTIWSINESKTAFEPIGNLLFPVLNPISVLKNDILWIFGGQDISRSPQFLILKHNLSEKNVVNAGIIPFEISNRYPSFVYQDYLYVFNEQLELWRFDFETLEWSYITNYPGNSLLEGIAEVIDHTLYVGLAKERLDMHKLNLLNLTWKPTISINDFNRNITNGAWAYDDKLYVLRRSNVFDSNNSNMVMWVFNPESL